MSIQDPRQQFESQVQMYLEQIRRGGTPPFVSDPAYREARRRSMGGDPRMQMLQLLLGASGNRGAGIASNVIGLIQPAQQLLGLLLNRRGGNASGTVGGMIP